jgi:hypothetical protein
MNMGLFDFFKQRYNYHFNRYMEEHLNKQHSSPPIAPLTTGTDPSPDIVANIPHMSAQSEMEAYFSLMNSQRMEFAKQTTFSPDFRPDMGAHVSRMNGQRMDLANQFSIFKSKHEEFDENDFSHVFKSDDGAAIRFAASSAYCVSLRSAINCVENNSICHIKDVVGILVFCCVASNYFCALAGGGENEFKRMYEGITDFIKGQYLRKVLSSDKVEYLRDDYYLDESTSAAIEIYNLWAVGDKEGSVRNSVSFL